MSSSGAQFAKREKVCKSVFSGAFRIVVGTSRGAQEIIAAYGVNQERLMINPLPVDFPRLPSSISRDPTQIIYPANFWPHKNHVILIEALKLLKERSTLNINLVLTGSDKGALRAVKALVAGFGLQNSVHFLGFVSKPEL